MKNTSEKVLPETSEQKIPSTRSRIRQDKFSSTLHLACFRPEDTKPKS